ncbi:MAG: phytanoyl-CoA dioxygenase family protein, partial [Rhodospirillales bacterium]|nr:phytanoyl-CoA dioxygenase family protein [Rhodospirillales bacterium]
MLNQAQIDEFRKNGFVVAPGVVSKDTVDHLLARLDEWVEESRSHTANFDTDTPDGKARFDLEDGHNAEHPRLRRVANPCDVSERYANVLFDGAIPTAVSDPIGP